MSLEREFDTLAIHAGQAPDPVTGAVMPVISLSTTFAQDGPGGHKGFEYSRTDNPTRRMLEHCMAALEGGKHGFAFGSGCAAMTTLLQTLAPGDHVVCSDDVYGGSFRILDKVFKGWGISTTRVDMTRPERIAASCGPRTRSRGFFTAAHSRRRCRYEGSPVKLPRGFCRDEQCARRTALWHPDRGHHGPFLRFEL